MTAFLVLAASDPSADMPAAIRAHAVRVLGEWAFAADHPPATWLPRDPAYAYVDTRTGDVHAQQHGRMQIIGNLISLLGYHTLDAALTEAPALPAPAGAARPGQAKRVRVDLGLAYDIDTRLMGRSAVKAALPHLTDKDIHDLADAGQFRLARAEAVTMLVSLLKAIRPEHQPIYALEVFTRLDPLPEETLPSWHPRATPLRRAS